MSRRRLIVLYLPVAAILAVAGLFYLLLNTAPGARWLWERANAVLPGELQSATLSGDIQSGLRLEKVRYQDGGLSVQADTLNFRIDIDLLPPSLDVHGLELGTLEIQSASDGDSTLTPLDSVLEAMALPLPVRFEEIRVGRIAWQSVDGESGWEIGPLALSADWFRDLELKPLHLDLPASGIKLRGWVKLGLQAPFSLDLEARGAIAAGALSGYDQPLDLDIRLAGNLRALRVDGGLQEPPLFLKGSLDDLLGAPTWDLTLSADQLSWPLDSGDGPPIYRLTANSYGWIDDYGLEVAVEFDDPPPAAMVGLNGLHGRLVGAGDQGTLQIDVLDIGSESFVLDGSGRLDWDEEFSAAGAFNLERVDPAPWFEPWGEAAPVSGALELALREGRVEFSGRDLHAPGSIGQLSATGAFDLAESAIRADLDWRELTWPPGAAEPEILSPAGSVRVAGRLDQWSLDGNLELDGPDFPPGRLRVVGTGDTQSAAMEILRGEILGGILDGTFAVRWAPNVSWSATARFGEISTGPLAPSWPGRISGRAILQGQMEPRTLDVDIRELNGELRGRPVAAAGGLRYESNRLLARELDLRIGTSEVSLDGDLGARTGLTFSARIDSLSDLADGAGGSLAGGGTVSLDPERPSLVLNLEGGDLSWAGFTAEALRVVTGPGPDATVRLEAERIGIGDTQLDSLAAITGSRRPLDEIEVTAGVADSEMTLVMSGRIPDWSAPLTGGWLGSLEQFRWEGERFGWIELEEAGALTVNDREIELESACFGGSRQGRLCLEAHLQAQGQSEVEASLENVSPNLALSLADSDLVFTQLLSGTVAWQRTPAGQARATVDLSISPGDVRVEGDDKSMISTGRGRFGFEIADGRLFAGELDIPVPGSGGIDTDFSAPDLTAGLSSPVQGRLQLNLKDIGPVLQLMPAIEGSSGPVAADMRFSGTLDDPRFTGHASLVRGRIYHFASGLRLEELKLAGAVYEFDQTELFGTFRAGDGEGTIRAVVNFDEILAPEIRVELEGEGLTLVNVPDLNVTADPDVRLTWRDSTLSIAGRVRVPKATLSPRYLPTTGAAESPDVVIVAGEDPLARPEEDPSSDWRMAGELELELGENVQVQLERAQARLRGTAVFRWNDKRIPSAAGGFEVNGEIYAYGQLLSVTEGRINFANRPADNPFLTIRAEREIFGNSQVRQAGVLVTGTLKRPVLEPYTDPMTTRERALTLLVTGNDFNYEQGVGAVEVGMYVAPKLFLSYGVGLFDDQSVISARYDLGKGFGIKATSGQRETGADISYTIER